MGAMLWWLAGALASATLGSRFFARALGVQTWRLHTPYTPLFVSSAMTDDDRWAFAYDVTV